MSSSSDSPLDRLWQEYSEVFRDFDDLTLARWLAQTLGQLEGRAWRLSHPLLGACRLAAQLAHDRQVWLKRLATPPAAYRESPCCRAPLPCPLPRPADRWTACAHGIVSTRGPSSVIATVCSKCAARVPSDVRSVQPSSAT